MVNAQDLAAERYRRFCHDMGAPCWNEFTTVNHPSPLATEPALEELRDTIVLSGEWWVVAGGRTRRDNWTSRPRSPSSIYTAGGTPDRRRLIFDRPIDPGVPEAFLLGGTTNYAHWLFDKLPLLRFYPQLPAKTAIVVNHRIQGFQLESLALLGIDRSILVPVTDPGAIRVPRLWHPVLVSGLYQPPLTLRPEPIEWLRARLLDGRERPAGRRRIYISRRHAPDGKRRLLNDEEVAALGARYGFETVFPEELSFAAQIELFADAAAIMAPHGAGLANCLFAPRSCAVLELTGPLVDTWLQPSMIFGPLFAALGQRHIRVVGQGGWDAVPPDKLISGEPYTLPLDRVEAALAQLRSIV